MTMLPFDVYVHPSFSYKPNEWAATSSSSSQQPTKASLMKKTIVTAAALGFTAAATTAGALVYMTDREVLVGRDPPTLILAYTSTSIRNFPFFPPPIQIRSDLSTPTSTANCQLAPPHLPHPPAHRVLRPTNNPSSESPSAYESDVMSTRRMDRPVPRF
ncbi:hypothetical protein SCHPADRAFT_998167 [Schizopora paradoxa]|uniref:Uncharacterized protein n=1 Tax=Schizopora paradoxa TaxID=27342 RepID=A0A0H2RKE0_9AGAM|nr:hypothetical protein SCHPADRAFT_998167 [Schizopora paradoxa]